MILAPQAESAFHRRYSLSDHAGPDGWFECQNPGQPGDNPGLNNRVLPGPATLALCDQPILWSIHTLMAGGHLYSQSRPLIINGELTFIYPHSPDRPEIKGSDNFGFRGNGIDRKRILPWTAAFSLHRTGHRCMKIPIDIRAVIVRHRMTP
jgi:hypothetical protein